MSGALRTMKRLPTWRQNFHELLSVNRSVPFEYGSFDCGLFAMAAVHALLGVDLSIPYRGKYATLEEANALLQADGHKDIVDYFRHALRLIPSAMARQGDLATVEVPELGQAMGVVLGSEVMIVQPTGLGTVNRISARHAFQVGL